MEVIAPARYAGACPPHGPARNNATAFPHAPEYGATVCLGMTIVLIGLGLLAAVLGLFYLKDRLESPLLARIAYSEPMMRFAVVAAALVAAGLLIMLGKLFP